MTRHQLAIMLLSMPDGPFQLDVYGHRYHTERNRISHGPVRLFVRGNEVALVASTTRRDRYTDWREAVYSGIEFRDAP